MKNFALAVLSIISLGLSAALLQQHRQSTQLRGELALLQQQAADVESELAQRDSRLGRLLEQIERTQRESVANAGAAAQLSQALTNLVESAQEPTNAKPANPFAEMFKNPEMRDMIKQQQKNVLGGMVDKNYAAFFKSMNLTPEQTAAMKELIMSKMFGGAELGLEMLGGEIDAEKRAELTGQMKESADALNSQIRELLGTENYSLFESYEKSIPDRMAVSQLQDQLGDTMALNPSQEQLLIAAMSEERRGFKFTTDFSDQNAMSADIFNRFNEESINTFFQEQERLNQRYLTRAQPILTAEQYATYQKSLAAQQEMTRMGMKMAASMFGNQKK